jgi:hypothetical protein
VIPCIQTIATGNNFSTVYAPLIHDRSFIGWPLMKTTELVCATALSDLIMWMMWSLFKLVNQIPHQPISQVPDFDSGTFLEHVMCIGWHTVLYPVLLADFFWSIEDLGLLWQGEEIEIDHWCGELGQEASDLQGGPPDLQETNMNSWDIDAVWLHVSWRAREC